MLASSQEEYPSHRLYRTQFVLTQIYIFPLL